MFRSLVNMIANGLSFSKNEAKGTLLLIFIISIALVTKMFFVGNLTSFSDSSSNDARLLAEWIKENQKAYKRDLNVDSLFKDQKKLAKPYKKKLLTNKKLINDSGSSPKESLTKEKVILDINIASREDLQEIKGIGKVFSERIIKFRNSLGGFSKMDQLFEVYNLDSSVVNNIMEEFSIQSKPQSFDFNADSAKTLARHPYISYDLAWVLINYRKQNGPINRFEDLLQIKAIDDSLLLKLRPYIH